MITCCSHIYTNSHIKQPREYASYTIRCFTDPLIFQRAAPIVPRTCNKLAGRQRSCKPCTSYDRDVRPSVRPSVCPSVTCWHWVKTTQARITKSSPTDSPRILVFGIKNSFRNSKAFTPSEGVKWEWGRENSQFSANNSPYLRNGAR